jgi:hypothetical protein
VVPKSTIVGSQSEIEDKEEWEDTIERLVGIHRVLKPHLITHYSAHLAAANPIYEPPTLRILAHLVEGEKRHVERGLVVLGDLLDSAEAHRRASQWQSHLEELMAAAEIFIKLLEYVGSFLGEFPETEVLWSCTQIDDPACRVAGIKVFSFRGTRLAIEDVREGSENVITIAREARLLAGFSEEEIARLISASRKSAAY